MSCIEKSHQNEYGEYPETIVEVPRIATILGTFSDCIGGYAIMGTANGGIEIAISRRDDNTVKVFNPTKLDKKKFQVTNVKYRKEDRWANAIKAIIYELGYLGFSLSGMNITIQGDGSICDNSTFASISFIGMLLGLDRLYSLGFDKERMKRIAYTANRFSNVYQARLRDLIVLLYSEENSLMFFDLDSYRYEYSNCKMPDGVTSLFVSTSIPFSVLTPEFDDFNENLSELVEDISSRIPKGIKLRDLTDKELRLALKLSAEQRRRLLFVLEESSLAKKAWDAIKEKDHATFGKILNMHERAMEVDAELTSPEIDWIAKRGSEIKGLYGLCQVYTGCAGTLLALIDSSTDFPYTSRLEEYERIFGFHAVVEPYIPYVKARSIEGDESPTCQ